MTRKRLTTFGKVLDVLTRTALVIEGIVFFALPNGVDEGMSIPFYICATVTCGTVIYVTWKFYEYIFIK